MGNTDGRDFFVSVLDSLTQQVAVIDAEGRILWVNRAWKAFSEENGGDPDQTWRGTNYLQVCRSSAEDEEQDGADALGGLGRVIRGEAPVSYLEYPCHSPTEQRWFMMQVRPLDWAGPAHFVITHQNITERKLAELQVAELAILDGLTGVANRRRFDEFLGRVWRRARRLAHPVSLVLFDIDFFKAYNDTYGHWAGDECLRRVGAALRPFARRPDDLAARYGGEEFALILGSTHEAAAREIANEAHAAIQALNIRHNCHTNTEYVTVSGGVATLRPDAYPEALPSHLIEAADQALYAAKKGGRNRVRSEGEAILGAS